MTNPVGVKKRRVSVFSSAAKSHQQWCLGSGYAKITFLPKTCCEHFMDSDSSGQSVGSEGNLGLNFKIGSKAFFYALIFPTHDASHINLCSCSGIDSTSLSTIGGKESTHMILNDYWVVSFTDCVVFSL